MYSPPSPLPTDSDSSYYGSASPRSFYGSEIDPFDTTFLPTSAPPSDIWGSSKSSFFDSVSPLSTPPPELTSPFDPELPTGTVNPCSYNSNPLPSPAASVDSKIFWQPEAEEETSSEKPSDKPAPKKARTKKAPRVKKEVVESDDEEEKLFPCSFADCTRTFNRLQNLRAHVKCHTNERPYPCNSCPAKFRRLPDLERHKRSIHNTSRPFVCQECGKAYARSDALKRHMVSKSSLHGCPAKEDEVGVLSLGSEVPLL
ncbi:hypothetical protein HK097_004613 [Rhizophlyctis rosea]|uniref:C2H2-type domain-containing protein n=1 Tax=Rhizophlyctis rosea TaxID=64517 RepID=A0AAD5SKK2_9FUNG|nr:hypothetical protein HK097_004613 [Rhizophlyctis rosea]